MKGGVTVNEMACRKQKAANLDAALRWIDGRAESADLLVLRTILRRGLLPEVPAPPQASAVGDELAKASTPGADASGPNELSQFSGGVK